MAPCLYVPESESCAREPSMTATDQAQPSKLPMREPSAREPSMVAPDQTKPSKLICFGKFHYMFFDSLLVNTIFQFIFVH